MTLSTSGGPPEGLIERRVTGAAVLIVACWMLLLGRLFYLQVLQGETYAKSAQRNSVRTHRVEAPRGMILDRWGEILVDSRPSFEALVVPHETEDLERTLLRVASVLDHDPAPLLERLGSPRGGARFNAQRIAYDVERDAFARLEGRLWALPGVLTRVSPLRDYRFGASTAHVLGWLGEIDADQLKKRDYQGYRRGDVLGRKGVERLVDRDLRGRPGGRNVLVDAHGRELRTLSEVEAQPGRNVVLTIDHDLQEIAERALAENGWAGAVVALDPRTGAVLSLASAPSFDPNRFAKGVDAADWQALVADPKTPLHNRALQGQYPPGSTYKVVTAIAGLEEELVDAGTEVVCNGSWRLGRRRYRCWRRGGHGRVDIHKALVQSCDVFFYQLGHQVGVDRLAYYARALGLGSPTGIEIAGETAGLVPTARWKERRFGEPWIKGETISLAIGQGFNLWTPIQLAQAYAAIATGQRYRPYVIQRIQRPDGERVRETEPELLARLPFSEQNLQIVRAGLRGVVAEPRGTGYAMRRVSLEAAGKTGTAQVVALKGEQPEDEMDIPEKFRDHGWFATYLPFDDPALVIGVLVEHGLHGASAAAPIAAEMAQRWVERASEKPADASQEELHARN